MSQVCRPTPAVRFMHTSELSLIQQLISCMVRLTNTVVFLPTALCCGTRRNAIQFCMYSRTTDVFFGIVEKAETRRTAGWHRGCHTRGSIQGFSPRVYKSRSGTARNRSVVIILVEFALLVYVLGTLIPGMVILALMMVEYTSMSAYRLMGQGTYKGRPGSHSANSPGWEHSPAL
jgi:hypothetical protein